MALEHIGLKLDQRTLANKRGLVEDQPELKITRSDSVEVSLHSLGVILSERLNEYRARETEGVLVSAGYAYALHALNLMDLRTRDLQCESLERHVTTYAYAACPSGVYYMFSLACGI